MSNRLANLAATLGVTLLLFALLPLVSVATASPWWQVLDGSRPTNLWVPTDNVQEIETELIDPGVGEEVMVGKIEVGGNVVACMGTSGFFGSLFCEGMTGFPSTETAAQLETVLESAYGTDALEVAGGPVGGDPFLVTFFGKSVPPIKINTETEPQVFLGKANVKTLVGGGSGRLVLTVTNLGNAPVDGTKTPVTIVDELPEGVIATGAEAFAGVDNEFGPVDCTVEAPDRVACLFEGVLPSYEAIEMDISASLTGNPPVAGAPGEVTVSGGNAAPKTVAQVIEADPANVSFGIERFSAQAEEEGGDPATQAGNHPFQLTTTIQFNSGAYRAAASRRESTIEQPTLPGVDQPALTRNLSFPLPAGLVGNATAMPYCEMSDFFELVEEGSCPAETAIGVASATIFEKLVVGFARFAVPVFNLPPKNGEPARFGFNVEGTPVVVDTAVDPDDRYRIVASVRNTTQIAQLLSSTVVLWGSPGDSRHDSSRGWSCLRPKKSPEPCERPPGLRDVAFLRQPVSCDGPLDFDAKIEPWNVPTGSMVDSRSYGAAALRGCNRVPFDPRIAASPTSTLAENPSGLEFRLEMPNSGLANGDAIAEGQPKKVEVTLPEGVTINPSQAEGLAVCAAEDYARERYDSASGAGCPDASKIGDVEVSTPLLEEEAKGSLFVAKPYDNPFDSLLALYLVARIPERGILIKQAGKVEPDPQTGQLVTTFDDLPQLPFSSFKLRFREGGRAPLATPVRCGTYETVAKFTPWSASNPDNPLPNEVITRTSSFTIDRGVDGGPCPSGSPSFDPSFEAGSINPAAGKYSPFYMRLTRKDGEQNLSKFSATLPKGALAKLAGVSRCPQAAVEAAKGRTGLEEKVNPSCPANSLVGRTNVGAGVGSILTYVPGQLYLGGPYNGAPLSIISITPAVAGPFDVGTVVVQEALSLDPRTGEARVNGAASDPIPHILAGIPLKLRDLRVYVDRPEFTTTPTSCDPLATQAELFGSGLDVFSTADDHPVALSARYQAANCANLGFKPRLKIRLTGKRSTRGAHPALRAVLRPRIGEANARRISVALPGTELLENAHIRTVCTRVQFAAGGGMGRGCPQGSIYGHVKAWTPLLDEPLEGPVFLRSSNHELPDLVLALRGLVEVEAAGRIDAVNGRIRTTFEDLPDAPLTKVVLSMQGARKGLLANSTDICRGVHRFTARLTGQNGKLRIDRPPVTANCKGKRR